ncbi:MAG: LCP family protein [Oscillospiraceae bacterium]|nr:LCP family protein [Oscillospiraceae bacterium]
MLKTILTVLAVLLVLGLAVAAVGYGLFRNLYGKMNIQKEAPTPDTVIAETTEVPGAPTPEAATEAPTDTPEPTPEPTPTEEELQAMAEQQLIEELQEDAEEILFNDNVYNLLLIGADGTSDAPERGDAIILLSINKETKRIWLTSLMRDTQVTVPGWGLGHLNWTVSKQNYSGQGSPQLLIKTIESEKNFAIHIDNWALVNFVDFAEIAGMLGPIKVTVTAEEAQSMNGLIRQVARMRDEKLGLGLNGEKNTTYRSYFPKKGGTFEITDGIQILAYCRERYAGTKGEFKDTRYGDTGRSNKQREVLMLMWENVKKMNILQQYELAEKVMSIVTTDLTQGKCASLLLQAPTILKYEIKDQQCPHPYAMGKGRDASGLSVYFPDWRVNRNYLRATIYGQPLTAADLTSGASGTRYTIDPEA